MIVLDGPGDDLTVLEGNRRLTALKGLADPDVSATFRDPELWGRLHESATIPEQVPVIRATSRAAVAPLIGYRHISGIEPWKPWQKARFIADLVDNQGLTFDEVNEQVGEPRNTVATLYRNRAMLIQAASWGFDTTAAEEAFGVFTAALNRRAVREFVHAPTAPQVAERSLPLADDRETKEALGDLLGWVFGERRVIKDSRELKDLAWVLDSPRALPVLKETRNLAAAYREAGGPQQVLAKRLRSASDELRAALVLVAEDPSLGADEAMVALARECLAIARDLTAALPEQMGR